MNEFTLLFIVYSSYSLSVEATVEITVETTVDHKIDISHQAAKNSRKRRQKLSHRVFLDIQEIVCYRQGITQSDSYWSRLILLFSHWQAQSGISFHWSASNFWWFLLVGI